MPPINKYELELLEGAASKSQQISLHTLIRKYLMYWPLFLSLIVICIIAAFLYLYFKVPVYETKATLLIKDEKKGVDESKVMDAINLFSSKKIVENEIEVIKSKTLAQNVVRNLHLYAAVYEEDGPIDRSAYVTSPVWVVAQNPNEIYPIKKQYFRYEAENNKVVLNKKTFSLDTWIKTPYGNLQFIPNPLYQPSSNRNLFFFSLLPVKKVANDIGKRLDVLAANKLSTVIDLSIKDEVPQRGENILNELVNVYNKAAITDKNILAANTLSFVEDRLKYVVQDLSLVEKQLQSFKAKNNLIDIGVQGKVFLENVGANDQKIGDISMQIAILNQVENYVSGKDGKGSIVPSTLGVTEPVLSGLLDKLYNTELEYEKLRKIAPENNPMLISLADQINKIKPSILENIQNQRRSLQVGKSDLNNTNSRYVSKLQTIPAKERELLEISRQQSIKNNIYTFLLQKREEAALSYASTVADSRLVDKAESSENPVSPNVKLIYLTAVLTAFALGITYIFIKEMLNDRIDSRAEVEVYTKVPILGEVLYNDTEDPIVVDEQKQSLIAEQFRQLRTSLNYLGINYRRKKVLITSSISGEGKSFIAINLSASLAMANKKVVIVELDLRKPKLAKTLNMNDSFGVVDFLQGEKEIEEIIKSVNFANNLFVIPAGVSPFNPSELLINGKIEELFSYLEKIFDYIIIDSSPINPVTDAYILSPLCDATLYIIRQGITPKVMIQKLDERFQTKGLKNMAIILNCIKVKGFIKNYNYDLSYGYNYISNNHQQSHSNKGISKLFT